VINATGPGTLRLLPALIVTADECDEALRRIGRLLGE
jgi:acetylornithine/succinyldiaminopimelate/putrescine aminotransferase